MCLPRMIESRKSKENGRAAYFPANHSDGSKSTKIRFFSLRKLPQVKTDGFEVCHISYTMECWPCRRFGASDYPK